MDHPEGSDTIIEKTECPQCHGSGNTLTVYGDGHAHCFGQGCGYFKPATGVVLKPGDAEVIAFGKASSRLLDPDWAIPANKEGLHKRGLTAETLRKLGVFQHGWQGRMAQVFPYYDMDGVEVAQKLRPGPEKEFPVIWEEGVEHTITKLQLFGRHHFGDRYDRQVVITEGELDAASVAQATGFKIAVASVGAGADGAAKHLKENYLWLDRFSEIILWFDNDEAGKKATQECAALFKVGKVRVATATGFKLDGKTPNKDASDILQANRPGDIQACVYSAVAWRPKGIVNAAANASDVMAPRDAVLSYNYPACMEKLQEMTGGLYPGEVIYHVAGTGVGKSTDIREIQYDLAVNQEVKIAVMSFEDTKRDAKFGLMSIHTGERLHLAPVPRMPNPKDYGHSNSAYAKAMDEWEAACTAYDVRMSAIHTEVFGAGRVELFDPETADWSMDAIMGYVRYCAKALECQVVFIDPISFIASGIELTADERRVLDKVAGEFAKMAKELNIHIQISHHLKRVGQGIPHEEGAPTSLNELRSSGGLANFATGVIGWERNNQAEGEGWRVTRSRIIKPIRRTGRSGLADVLYYGENGRLIKSPIPFPPIGKPEGAGGDQPRKGGFSPANEDGRDY